MNDKNKNLLLRVISALVLLPVVLYCLYRGDWWTALLLAWASASVAYEYITITLKGLSPVGVVAVLGAGALPILPVWKPFEATALVCGILGVVIFSGWLWHLVKGPLPEAPVRVAHLVTAVVYGGGGMISLMSVRNLSDGAWWVVCALVVTWMNDTTAYFAGRFLGKHKLYEAVSPKKTVEGAVGGLAGSVLGAVLAHFWFLPSLELVPGIVLALIAGALGQAGDLGESLLKRSFGVKDSGAIVPGHGGILDRVDALMLTAAVTFLYTLWFVRA